MSDSASNIPVNCFWNLQEICKQSSILKIQNIFKALQILYICSNEMGCSFLKFSLIFFLILTFTCFRDSHKNLQTNCKLWLMSYAITPSLSFIILAICFPVLLSACKLIYLLCFSLSLKWRLLWKISDFHVLSWFLFLLIPHILSNSCWMMCNV